MGFAALVTAVMLRFGLLTLVTAQGVSVLLQTTPWTLDLGAWFAPPALGTLAIVLALAGATCYWSRAGEPLFGRALME